MSLPCRTLFAAGGLLAYPAEKNGTSAVWCLVLLSGLWLCQSWLAVHSKPCQAVGRDAAVTVCVCVCVSVPRPGRGSGCAAVRSCHLLPALHRCSALLPSTRQDRLSIPAARPTASCLLLKGNCQQSLKCVRKINPQALPKEVTLGTPVILLE